MNYCISPRGLPTKIQNSYIYYKYKPQSQLKNKHFKEVRIKKNDLLIT